MKVTPYNSDYADIFLRWFHDPRLRNFFRGFTRGCSKLDATNAEAFMHAHLLLAFDDIVTEPVGLVSLADKNPILRIYKLGLLVTPEQQSKKYAIPIFQEGLKWAFNRMSAHKVKMEVLASDTRLSNYLDENYALEGEFEAEAFIDGKFHNERSYGILQRHYRENI